MKDIYPMWKMCYVFRLRELSRDADHSREKLLTEGLSGEDLEDAIVLESSKGKSYGITLADAIGSYVFHYNPSLRNNDGKDTVSVRKVRKENPAALDEAIRALRDSIGAGFVRIEDDRVFLESGRTFAAPKYWSFRGKLWNIPLLNMYLEKLGPTKSVLIAIFGSSAVVLGTKWVVLSFVPLLAAQISALIQFILNK